MAPPARQTKSPGWAVTTSPVFWSAMNTPFSRCCVSGERAGPASRSEAAVAGRLDRLRQVMFETRKMPPHRRFRGVAIASADGVDDRLVLGQRLVRPAGQQDDAVLEPHEVRFQRREDARRGGVAGDAVDFPM